jgi:TPR repeat protein
MNTSSGHIIYPPNNVGDAISNLITMHQVASLDATALDAIASLNLKMTALNSELAQTETERLDALKHRVRVDESLAESVKPYMVLLAKQRDLLSQIEQCQAELDQKQPGIAQQHATIVDLIGDLVVDVHKERSAGLYQQVNQQAIQIQHLTRALADLSTQSGGAATKEAAEAPPPSSTTPPQDTNTQSSTIPSETISSETIATAQTQQLHAKAATPSQVETPLPSPLDTNRQALDQLQPTVVKQQQDQQIDAVHVQQLEKQLQQQSHQLDAKTQELAALKARYELTPAQRNVDAAQAKEWHAAKDFQSLFDWSQKAAANKDPLGAFHLGVLYYEGRLAHNISKDGLVDQGAPALLAAARFPDYHRAFRLWTFAAKHGLADAKYRIGLLHFDGHLESIQQIEPSHSIEWAGPGGNFPHTHYGGEWGPDCDTAIEWYTAAAEQGHQQAQYILGRFLNNPSEAFVKDDPSAPQRKWYTHAAFAGHQDAQYALGMLYNSPGSIKLALHWFTRAAAQGNVGAAYQLGHHYRHTIKSRRKYKSRSSGTVKQLNRGVSPVCVTLNIITSTSIVPIGLKNFVDEPTRTLPPLPIPLIVISAPAAAATKAAEHVANTSLRLTSELSMLRNKDVFSPSSRASPTNNRTPLDSLSSLGLPAFD